jgi:NAD(P)-dependent dehydrogenase (short-subunit alcohol dehydrogenase family)
MDLGLKGKNAIITGSTRGIGRAIAECLASEGCNVAIGARDDEATAQAGKEIAEKHGVKVFAQPCNVKDADAYKAWLEAAIEELGGLDIFVPNVSGGGGMDSEKNWWRNFEIDVLHTVRGAETCLPALKASGAGAIVIIGSTNAVETFMGPMAYNAMKAALVTYSKQLSQFVAAKGVRVNTVSPGPIYFEGGAWEMIKGTMPKVYEGTLKQIPAGRMGTPEEVARVVAFLASPAASLVTGINLVADNGFTKRVQL